MMSIPEIENAGLGRRLDENQGQRGHFKVERVETWNPFTEQGQAIYEAGSSSIYVPGTNITITQCLQYAEQLNKERITLQFLTPLRLIDHENLVTQIRFRPLIQRLLERYLALERHYGNPNLFLEREERSALLQQAETITCTIDQTHWQELRSYSNRQKRATAIGGLIGLATFEGNLQPFLGLLTIGELVHVGKSAVKGNGWYRIHP
jgi:hypothetical protein